MTDIKRDWTKVGDLYSGLETNIVNNLTYKRESIPIIFVPGIMGSRLKRTSDDEPVWDPDSNWLMVNHYLSWRGTPSHRKKLLIGDLFAGDYLSVDESFRSSVKKTVQELLPDDDDARHGWGGVSWESYGDLLKTLAGRTWSPFTHIFALPVYAMGYNWTNTNVASGRALAKFIDQVMGWEKAKNRTCEKVVLVTHSMGGLVARAACSPQVGNAAGKVLGVVHGVQPVTGAAAAYWRMKGGFERPDELTEVKARLTAITLGATGEEVTVVLGNMPGGLQLLPSSAYGPGWLHVLDKTGKLVAQLPKANPYGEIYREKTRFWRMANLADLDPDGDYESVATLRWRFFEVLVTSAERFHDALDNYHHKKTFAFHGNGKAPPTADSVKFTLEPWGVLAAAEEIVDDVWLALKATVVGSMVGGPGVGAAAGGVALYAKSDAAANRGGYRDYLQDTKGDVFRLELLDPDGAGDGTVPIRSGAHFKGLDQPISPYWKPLPAGYAPMEHEPAFAKSSPGLQFTISAILELCAARYKVRRQP